MREFALFYFLILSNKTGGPMEFIKQLEKTIGELSIMTEEDFKQIILKLKSEIMSDKLKNNIIKCYIVSYNLSKKEKI